MSPQKQQSSNAGTGDKPKDYTGIYIALIALVGTIITAVINHFNIRTSIELPIAATQTAEARITLLVRSVTPTIITATRISEQPTAVSSSVVRTPTPTTLPIRTPTPTRGFEQTIDSFENYSISFIQENFKINRHAGNDLTLYSAGIPHVSQGNQALAFEYNIRNVPPQHYVGFGRNLPIQDWSKYSKLCVWVESDGSNRNLVIQFGEHDNNFRKSNFPLSGRGATDYCVSLSTQPSIDLRLIGYYGIYVEGPPQGQGVIYIDNVRLLP